LSVKPRISCALASTYHSGQLTRNIRNIVADLLFSNDLDILDILGRELDLLEVLDDTRWCDGFGDHAVAADFGPCQTVSMSDDVQGLGRGYEQNLSRRHCRAGLCGEALCDDFDLWAGHEEGNVEHVVAERLEE
jgi:hypothetical protein